MRELKIETLITASERENLILLLREYVNVFAWSYADMFGLDNSIIVHKVSLNEWNILVKQKLQRTRPNMVLKVKVEIEKQWDASFLEMVRYPKWVLI
jgi:hypothetical protein